MGGPDAPPPGPGFYGKLPARGDFLTRALPRSFVDPWDRWLQTGMAGLSRERLPEPDGGWRNAATWRFAVMPGLCGPSGMAGILAPSADRVGRRFPLTIALPLPGDAALATLPDALAAWFDALDGVIADALDVAGDPAVLEAELADFDSPMVPRRPVGPADRDGLAVTLAPDQPLAAGFAPLLDNLLLDLAGRAYSLWWSKATAGAGPRLVLVAGLPPPGRFAAMLTRDEGP